MTGTESPDRGLDYAWSTNVWHSDRIAEVYGANVRQG
jgi:hypothetical protein